MLVENNALKLKINFYTDACPTNCKSGQTCDAADYGCPVCDKGYYGRQCQHRK